LVGKRQDWKADYKSEVGERITLYFLPVLTYLITWISQKTRFQETPKNCAPFCALLKENLPPDGLSINIIFHRF
jgi:hypothetical protein